jgi:hypothetical protein
MVGDKDIGTGQLGRKLFILARRLGVAAFGRGPDARTVPQTIDGFRPGNETAEEIAVALGRAFVSITAPSRFGLLVASYAGAGPVLWKVDVPGGGTTHIPFFPERTHVWHIKPDTLEAPRTWTVDPNHMGADALVELATVRVREAQSLAPTLFSKEIDRLLVTGAGWLISCNHVCRWHPRVRSGVRRTASARFMQPSQ